MLLPQEPFGMVPSTLHLGLLLAGGQWTDDVDAAGCEAFEFRIVDLGLCHQTSGGADNVVAFAVAAADVLGEDDFLTETTGLLAGWAHGNDLETHDGKPCSLSNGYV